MTYDTPHALRMALEQRLLKRSQTTGVSVDRLRRRVVFERVLARLAAAEPGLWVVKGGMALEVRLGEAARLTKDLDLGLRDAVVDAVALRSRLMEALSVDVDGDAFALTVGAASQLSEDGVGSATWRVKISAGLAGKPFGSLQLDVSPRSYELEATDTIALSNSLDFAGVPGAMVEILNINRHAAEKLHAMLRDFGDRENSRVRDLADLVLLIEHDLLDRASVAAATRQVWTERDDVEPPVTFPSLPVSWPSRYERLAADADLDNLSFTTAVALVRDLWAEMFPTEQT